MREIELKRHLFVTEEIFRTLNGGPTSTLFMDGKARAEITDFISGRMTVMSRQRRKWKNTDKPQLVQIVGHDEVWELCFREPRPGWRLFGRFIDQGAFVGFEFHDKNVIGNNYNDIAKRVVEAWGVKFPGLDPVRSVHADGYAGFNVRDIDETE